MSGRGVFLNNRCMDNLFVNRMITPVEDAAGSEADKTRGRVRKEKTEPILEISIGYLHSIKILLKIHFRCAPVFSNDP